MISWPSNEGKYSYKIIFWKEKKPINIAVLIYNNIIGFFLLNWDWRMYYIVDYNKKCKQNSSWKFCSNFFYSRLSKKPLFLYTPSYRQQGVWSLSLNNDCKYSYTTWWWSGIQHQINTTHDQTRSSWLKEFYYDVLCPVYCFFVVKITSWKKLHS